MKGSLVKFSDDTQYRQANDNGTLVRDPKKINGRERKRLRKAARRKGGK